jgi:predicted outer membrane protein
MKIYEGLYYSIVVCFIVLYCISCGSKDGSDKGNAEAQNKGKFKGREEMKDAQFVVDAIDHSYAMLELAALGEERGKSAAVKQHAQTIQDTQTSIVNELKVYAANNDISVPLAGPENTHTEAEDLNDENVDEFDKKWLDKVMRYNKKMIADFEQHTDKADGSLGKVVTASLSTLRSRQDLLKNYMAETTDSNMHE